ncbi:hypothetical protein Scep_012259 [Stephania cephalantha]|uniref:Uncharacterized protein n=1 Tax=Stephania cephalantha TaxID=152367 RepID=A0AAP0P9P5_9MAGN
MGRAPLHHRLHVPSIFFFLKLGFSPLCFRFFFLFYVFMAVHICCLLTGLLFVLF